MHDSRLEDQLRNALRTEGDGQPLTITTAELERRLVLRRRARNSQRLSLVAAAVAVVAIGSIVAIGNGWLRMPAVGVDPSPSPAESTPLESLLPTDSPIAIPTATPEPTPREAAPLGSGIEAILVLPTGTQPSRPDAFEVVRLDPQTGERTVIATIPGSVIPADGFLEEYGQQAPSISTTGRLAIPFRRGRSEDDSIPALAIVDVRAPDADPWIVNEFTRPSWNWVDGLIAWRGDEVWQIRVGDRYMARLFVPTGISALSVSATRDGIRLLARDDTTGSIGGLTFDGTFVAMSDLPPVFQRSGLERPAGDSGHTLGEACESGATAGSGGCYLIESDPTGTPATQWMKLEAAPPMHDFAWGVDGQSVWMLFDGDPDGSDSVGPQPVTLMYADTPGGPIDIGRLDFQLGSDSPALLGIIGEEPGGKAAAIALGTRQGLLRAVLVDGQQVYSVAGTAWFAGWAVDPEPYDPD